MDIKMNYEDLAIIIDDAKKHYAQGAFPLYLENDRGLVNALQGYELTQIQIVEATIQHLNSLGCLNKLAKFDYKKR